jgi:hypothetical protein
MSKEIQTMPFVGSFIPYPETLPGGHPEPEPGMQSSVHDPATSPHLDPTASIVPGGGDFSLPLVSSAPWSRPRAASSTLIQLQGKPGVTYQVKDPASRRPQWANATDPDTGAPTSSGRLMVQQNGKGQWMPFEATPIKVPGRPGDYVIADASNTSTPQQVFERKPNGDLVEVPGKLVYDGNHGVKLGLKGGTDASKDVRKARIRKAEERLGEAGRKLGAAQTEVARLEMKVAEAKTAMENAERKHEKANADYKQASNTYARFIGTLDWNSPRTAEETAEMNRLYLLQTEKGMSEIRANAELGTAKSAHSQASQNASRAEEALRPLRREVNSAKQALTAAYNSSF